MNMPTAATPQTRAHPMVIVAGTAAVIFCLTGTAALMGWIPSSMGRTQDPALPPSIGSAMPVQAPAYASVRAPHHAVPTAAAYERSRVQPVHHPAVACGNCGVVESTRELITRADGSGIGAAGGAIVGGLLGNQVGSGHGRQAMTVAGAIGGAIAGNQIEKRVEATRSYETVVRMNDGSTRAVSQAAEPQWHDGDHVRIVDGVVRLTS
ncbi:glycine zipper 2TM domain-containing protein [Massilia sp. CT11-108]|uniref:glycine zipper 2TM domain-containing protein n=1 Tax=Massilia sp. CT11-108 TaxID=3393900 RepID=UPI0039A4AD69